MGLILGRFSKRKTTLEKLEELDKDIKCIEKYKYHTQQTEKKIIGQFILISAFVYVIAVVLYYYYCLPSTWHEQVFYITPLLLIPFIIWFVKKLLKWYYRRKLTKNESKLLELSKEKKKLLDQVMDTETYKVAKTILEKFAPDNLRKSPTFDMGLMKSPMPQGNLASPAVNTMRHRNMIAAKTPVVAKLPVKMAQMSNIATPAPLTNGQRSLLSSPTQTGPTPGIPMARGILPRDRSMLDKMVEYLVGDGPSNRYALICRNCQSHNGMALREEFEYIAFRCCYCFTFNPSRKLRPSAPKLEEDSSPIRRRLSSENRSSSESEKHSETDTESEKENIKSSSKSVSDNERNQNDMEVVDSNAKEN